MPLDLAEVTPDASPGCGMRRYIYPDHSGVLIKRGAQVRPVDHETIWGWPLSLPGSLPSHHIAWPSTTAINGTSTEMRSTPQK